MIIATVSHKFASANHEEIKEKILYLVTNSQLRQFDAPQ
jgi:hypothetical protein